MALHRIALIIFCLLISKTVFADGRFVDGDFFYVGVNGNIGVGTIAPEENLKVVGNIKASGTVLGSNFTGTSSGTNTGDQNLSGYAPTTRTVNGHDLSTNVSVTASDLNLGNVTNTSDASKPVSTAQQTALDLKANLAGPTFTGTVAGITATMVGLGSVNNTADTAKPVSTAQQTALDLKSNLASPSFTGNVGIGTVAVGGLAVMSGNVGFGTWSPTQMLEVNGTVKANNISSPTFSGTVGIATVNVGALLTANNGITTAGATTFTINGTGGLTCSDTKACGTCTSSAATTCTATVRSGCKPVCSQSTSVSTTVRCAVSTTTLTCTFGTSGTNTCNFICF